MAAARQRPLQAIPNLDASGVGYDSTHRDRESALLSLLYTKCRSWFVPSPRAPQVTAHLPTNIKAL